MDFFLKIKIVLSFLSFEWKMEYLPQVLKYRKGIDQKKVFLQTSEMKLL